jgi:hypothetical protein
LVPPDKKMRLSSVHRLCHCLVEVYFTTLLHTSEQQEPGDTELLLHLTESVLRFVVYCTTLLHTSEQQEPGDTELLLHLTESVLRFVVYCCNAFWCRDSTGHQISFCINLKGIYKNVGNKFSVPGPL